MIWREKQRSSPRGKVEAEKARPMEETKVEAKGREKDVTKEVKIVYMITEPLWLDGLNSTHSLKLDLS